MSKLVEVELNKAETLVLLGTLYHSTAHAIKEYVSNAIDEWQRAVRMQSFKDPCVVTFHLSKETITIEYNAPGMDENEFELALKSAWEYPRSGTWASAYGPLIRSAM